MSQSVQEYRRRMARQGLKRVEVAASASDAELLRGVAKALDKDDVVSERLRATMQGIVGPAVKFKDWIAEPSDETSH
jgi:hypothetical protein